MLQQIKSKVYSSLLYLGSLYHRNENSKVIYYHDIHSYDKYTDMSTDFDLFKKHIECIQSMNFEIVKKITKPQKQIKISFDDGFRGVYNHKDYFVKNNIFPTIYIITSRVGHKNYLTWNEIRELDFLGFNIQAHTHLHSDLNILSGEELLFDLKTSKDILEKELHHPITEICFPKGLFSKQVLEVSKKIGFTECYSSIPGHIDDERELDVLYYRNLVQFATVLELKSILMGGMFIFKNRYRKQHYV
ncbi:polysaccharide deacetylase family protein [Flavobacterium croceum]|uniref:polysaccharide deacetylase family protein n=1 Tax=Flavobacterium croceum TaxID=370975 RepID=UPI0024A81CD7|nr:polysaccharide deacetylase family protein [Flavobacterium croceum]